MNRDALFVCHPKSRLFIGFNVYCMNRVDTFPGFPTAPAWTQDILKKYGLNPYGEPIFRISFLPARFYLVGGYWEQEDELTYKQAAKYGIRENKWMMERWIPASTYGSPETWEKQTMTPEGFLGVGPFPCYGEYECASIFSTGRGPEGYVPLEPGMVDLQARCIWIGKSLTVWDIRNSIKSEEEMKEARQDEQFDRMWEDVQLTRKGMTIGSGISYNPAAQQEEYKKRLLKHRKSWVPKQNFDKGFRQV